ncbi:MAG: hydroxyacid dehydrogenase [Armatimonadetes bacterium]|nr:hydroxyacid dehydrogenase [Armatimonadota bacterium]
MRNRNAPDIVVAEDIVGPAMAQLGDRFKVHKDAALWQHPDDLADVVSTARALIVRNRTQVTAELLQQADQLLVVGRAGAGLDNVDVATATELGIVVCYAPVQNAISVAEHTLGLMLALLRRISPADSSVRAGQWLRHEHTGTQLSGKTLGVIGLGHIGQMVGAYGQALGMELLGCDPYLSADSPVVEELGCELTELEDLLARADVITLHVPLTDQTHHLLDHHAFDRMKDTAVLINTSRGTVVNEEDLCAALEAGQIAGAGLDVRENEPPAPDSPLHRFDNTVFTPHIAAFTTEAQNAVVEAVATDVLAIISGKPAEYYANFPSPRR